MMLSFVFNGAEARAPGGTEEERCVENA